MQYIVIKPFQDITGFKKIGDPVELSDHRAAKLRRIGLIGGCYEQPIQIVAKETTPDFEGMTKKELVEYAATQRIGLDERMTKKQMIEELI